MIDNEIVIDAVAHAYNHLPSNFADERGGAAISELSYGVAAGYDDPRYGLSREDYLTDWQVPDVAKMLFAESDTDFAVMHPLALGAFKDGYVSVAKAVEAVETYPNRFIGAYACVDPLTGKEGLASLAEQVDALHPLGLKLYPASWDSGRVASWRMDDPKLIYPLYERAAELGLRHVAVHKAVPMGPTPMDSMNPTDLENAATDFPDLTFEIVHAGLSFLEETAWLLSRFSNIYVNMEIANIVVERRPDAFAEYLMGLCRIGGNAMLDRMFWGTGCALVHPQPGLRAFMDFQIPEEKLERSGLFGAMKQITLEDKRNMLGRTYAKLHGIDLTAAQRAIEGDEFSRPDGSPLPEPYSTIKLESQKRTGEVSYA